MFEDRTFENIMSEMMQDMPNDINTEEGSVIYNACAKQALKLEEFYLSAAYIYDNMLPDEQDEEHLIRYAKERGIEIKEATKAILLGEFYQEIEIGTRFTLNDMDYTAIELIDNYNYKLECEEPGIIGNTSFGELDPVDYVDEWQGGSITQVLVPGTDQEDVEVFRERVFATFSTKAFGGNRADYLLYFDGISSVGGVKIYRRQEEGITIDAYIQNSNYGVPSDALVDEVQTGIDPEVNQGEGEGFAPIGHVVVIHPVDGVSIDIEMKITFDEGYTFEGLKSYIEKAVDEYYLELNKIWKSSEYLTVRIAQLESRILGVTGVLDVSDTLLNEVASNVVLTSNQIPVRGELHAV